MISELIPTIIVMSNLFKLNEFVHQESFVFFKAEDVMGKFQYYIIDRSKWTRTLAEAVCSCNRSPRMTHHVYFFTEEEDAIIKGLDLLSK
jgi:hypothetical protein